MRIAIYNVQNLFSRARAMTGDDPAKTSMVLAAAAELQKLIEQPVYSTPDKARMLAILRKHKALGDDGPFYLLETRKKLVSRNRIIASGRDAWVGSIEWRRDLVSAPAVENTGRIISEIKADVLCLVEVENRPVLRRFNDTVLKAAPYPHAMVIDGNDERGIDCGIASRWPIRNMRSHVDDPDPITQQPVFSRDCPEFQIDVPGTTRSLWVLINHFKSRGYGLPAENNAKRKRQSERVASILERFDLKKQWVMVVGDLNELPKSDSLAPLLAHTSLRNTFDKLSASADRWTHRDDATPSKNDQIDYILVSEALWPRVKQVHIERRGIWAHTKKARAKYPPLSTVTGETNSASDHAAVWAELDFP